MQLEETAKQQNSHIYAVIDAVSIVDKYPNQAQAVTHSCQTAFEIAEVTAKDIGYIEVHASGIREEDDGEVQGLIAAYKTQKSNLTCALGSVKTNIGDTHTASGMMSLIKTALCLYHRYIPAVPQWTGVKKLDIWHNTPFYFPTQSKPWFLEINTCKRIAAINSIETDRNIHIILSETSSELERSSKYLAQMPYYLFPIGGENQSSLVEKMIKIARLSKAKSFFSISPSKANISRISKLPKISKYIRHKKLYRRNYWQKFRRINPRNRQRY